MSTEKGEGTSKSSQSEAAQAKQKSDPPTEPQTPSPTASTGPPSQQQHHPPSSSPLQQPSITTPSRLFDEQQQQQQLAAVSSSSSSQPKTPPAASTPTDERKQRASTKSRDQASASTSPSTLETTTYAGGGGTAIAGGVGGGGASGEETGTAAAASLDASLQQRPRQVIAVSASKGPAAFFNLARKFLVTDEMCDLSALEGAIVSAVDAAHLLERSKLATIVRYVSLDRSLQIVCACGLCLSFVHISFCLVEFKLHMCPLSQSDGNRLLLLPFHHKPNSPALHLLLVQTLLYLPELQLVYQQLQVYPLQLHPHNHTWVAVLPTNDQDGGVRAESFVGLASSLPFEEQRTTRDGWRRIPFKP
jgi:hypothetical protein